MSAGVGEMVLREPAAYGLPSRYRQNGAARTRDGERDERGVEYWNAERIAASARYQWHVYAWARELVVRRGLRSVVDVGCGPGTKLSGLIAPVCADVTGLDQPSAVDAARRMGMAGAYGVIDLERCDDERAARTWDLVVCADVVEHLIEPDGLMRFVARCCHPGSLVLISTPDRERLRGRGCMACEKPEHVREWSEREFVWYVESRGFEVVRRRLLPGADEPARHGWREEAEFRLGRRDTSARRCLAVLCRVRPSGGG